MFIDIKKQVQENFAEMISGNNPLFITNVVKDSLWDTYLNSFEDPDIRQGNNCNSCRSFLRQYGNIVSIKDNKIVTLWDFECDDEEYAPAVKALRRLVASSEIRSKFLSQYAKLGVDKNKQTLENGEILMWNHFHIKLPRKFVSSNVDTVIGKARDTRNMFKRALDELTVDACKTVLELIGQNSLYRGSEFKTLVEQFLKAKLAYDKVAEEQKNNYVWLTNEITPTSITTLRNSSIGKLLIDLSKNVELDRAVKSFETIVAPTNYKRPTALITKGMIKEAEAKIKEMGLESSLSRRMATKDDISVSNLLFVDRGTKIAVEDQSPLDVLAGMSDNVPVNPKSLQKVEEISIDEFLDKVVPTIESAEVFLENKHNNNLMSLVTSENNDAPPLFKWDSPVSWSYVNNVTDSIKERVKAQGGNVTGELRCSLSWHNYDDLDIHINEPGVGGKIYYGSKRSITGGTLDVDMNAGGRRSKAPVENVIWTNPTKMREGEYSVTINNYARRGNTDVGYTVQIECKGEIFEFSQAKSPGNHKSAKPIKFTYSRAEGVKFTSDVKSNVVSKEVWGMDTNMFHKVNMILKSPNYWDKTIGNMHTFFILDDAKSDEAPRGFFNEFLKTDLEKNRKVFEVLGSKLQVNLREEQLSGIGFSSTQRNHVILRVNSRFSRLLKVKF